MLSYGFYCADEDYCTYHYIEHHTNARDAVKSALANKDCEYLVCFGIVGNTCGIDDAPVVWSR